MINRSLPVNKLRDAWVEINLGNLEYNINSIKEKIKASLPKNSEMPKLMAVKPCNFFNAVKIHIPS